MQRRPDAKLRVPGDDPSTSLLSTTSSTATTKHSALRAQRSKPLTEALSSKVRPGPTAKSKPISSRPQATAKPVIKKAVPLLALTKISSVNASGRANQMTSARQRVPAGHTASEHVSLNTSISASVLNSSHGAPLSLNVSQGNARPSEGAATTRETSELKSRARPRPPSMDLQPELPEAMWKKLQLPISGIKVLKLFKAQLSTYEQGEVLDYEAVYCLGFQAASVRKPSSAPVNFGYDDERGDYQVIIGDHIAYRYEVLSVLGKGSFGQVLKVHDHKTQSQFALKIIRNKSRFHHQAAVEVKILRYLREKDRENQYNVVHLQDYFVFRKHLCITFELLTSNLYDFLKSNNFQGLSSALIRRFAGQILVSLRALRKLRIIHCDLKPENILLKQHHKSGIKVIDFGSSCFDEERVYTYIQSRFYRAPEIILGIPYTSAIDMWSLGCILAELATGMPLFPGESEHEQLLCIMEVRGLPPEAVLEQSSRKKMFFDSLDSPKIIPNKRGKKRFPGTRQLIDALGVQDPAFLNFLERNSYSGCFEWDPKQRLTPDAALEHPWLYESLMRPSSGSVSSTTRNSSIQPKPVPSYAAAHRQKFSFGGGEETSLIHGKAISKQVPFTTKHTSSSFMFA